MSDRLKKLFATQNDEVIIYTAVIISSQSMGSVNLIKDFIGDIDINVDGTPTKFVGAMIEVPEQSILGSDDVDKGSIRFDRVGFEVVTKLRLLDNAPAFESVSVRILQYASDDLTSPQNDYTVYAANFNVGSRAVTIELTTQNLQKITRSDEIYNPSEFIGLENV